MLQHVLQQILIWRWPAGSNSVQQLLQLLPSLIISLPKEQAAANHFHHKLATPMMQVAASKSILCTNIPG